MRRFWVPVLVIGLLGLAGCGTRAIPERELRAALNRTERETKEFVYREEVEHQPAQPETENRRARPEIIRQANEVAGRIQDDLSYSVLYNSNGTQTAEAVVRDDALAVRILDMPSVLRNNQHVMSGPFAAAPLEDRQALDALFEGRWVLDYKSAPPFAAAVTREGTLEVGRNPAQDALYAFQYFLRAIDEAAGVTEFNPDEIGYNPADDPWAADAEADLRAKGIKRFDIVEPGLPRRGDEGSTTQEPGTVHFRKMAFYVRGDRVLKVVERINIEGQRDFRRILDLDRGSDYHRDMLTSAKEGGTSDQVRERTMSFEVFRLGQDIEVELPVAEALVGDIGYMMGGPDGLSAFSPFGAPRGRLPEVAPPDEETAPDAPEEASEADLAIRATTPVRTSTRRRPPGRRSG